MRYKIQILESKTGTAEIEWLLHLPAILGRCPEAEVPVIDASISRNHCQFYRDKNGNLAIVDLNSLNGTYIDDTRIQRSVVKPGSIVRVGAISMKVMVADEETISAHAAKMTPIPNPEQIQRQRNQTEVHDFDDYSKHLFLSQAAATNNAGDQAMNGADDSDESIDLSQDVDDFEDPDGSDSFDFSKDMEDDVQA